MKTTGPVPRDSAECEAQIWSPLLQECIRKRDLPIAPSCRAVFLGVNWMFSRSNISFNMSSLLDNICCLRPISSKQGGFMFNRFTSLGALSRGKHHKIISVPYQVWLSARLPAICFRHRKGAFLSPKAKVLQRFTRSTSSNSMHEGSMDWGGGPGDLRQCQRPLPTPKTGSTEA